MYYLLPSIQILYWAQKWQEYLLLLFNINKELNAMWNVCPVGSDHILTPISVKLRQDTEFP